ncbi:MAG: hypothetical protein SFV81_19820 [Pirellulaceae bacterium]|nr:hypothetical protein [Pirellulaceae bacterium]
MIAAYDLNNKGFAAKYAYIVKDKAYKAAQAMWLAGRPIASKALSKSFQAAQAASQKAAAVASKATTKVAPVKGGGPMIGAALIWLTGGDPVNDTIDSFAWTSRWGSSEPFFPEPEYTQWDEYQRELDAMAAEKEAFDEAPKAYMSVNHDGCEG